MLMTKFTHLVSFSAEHQMHTIVLTETESARTKVFTLAGSKDRSESLIRHMNSLTDDQCSQWFNAVKVKNSDKKAKAVSGNSA